MKEKIALVCVILLLFVLSGCAEKNYLGSVKNPKTPSVPKPKDLRYCEKDTDCTTSLYMENSCCLFCEGAVNKEGAKYLKEWYDLNCQNPKYSQDCLVYECCEVDDVKCINNTCTVISDCT